MPKANINSRRARPYLAEGNINSAKPIDPSYSEPRIKRVSYPRMNVSFFIVQHMLGVEEGSAGFGVDDHKGSRRAVPAEFGGRRHNSRGKLGLATDTEAVAEAVKDGPFFVKGELHFVGDAVGAHHTERVFRNDAVAKVADTAAGKGIGELNEVIDRGNESRAAAFVFRAGDVRVRQINAQSLFAGIVVAVLRSHPRADGVGRYKGGIDHSAGLKDVLFAVFAEANTRNDLDEASENVVAETVLELRARLKIERRFGKRRDKLACRRATVRALNNLADMRGGKIIIESRRHRKEVIEGDGRFAIDRKAAFFDVKLVKFGEILRDRIAHKEFSLLEKLKRGKAGHDLGAGIRIVKLVPAQRFTHRVTPKLLVIAVNDDVRRRNAVGGESIDEVFEIGEVHFVLQNN